ncbi:MAG: aspartate kinase [Candidatus Helarchaeota archaeon]
MHLIVIHKFGESCFIDTASFQQIYEIIRTYDTHKSIVVVAALPGIVSLLEDCAKKADTCASWAQDVNEIRHLHSELTDSLLTEPYREKVNQFLSDKFTHLETILTDIEEYGLSDNKLDIVLSFGEILSGYILNHYLISKGLESEYLLGDRFLITDSRFNNALPIMNISVRKVRSLFLPLLKLGHIPVITGFIGRNREGHLTTLGTGGPEFTAALCAYCLKDENTTTKVVIWKSINGIYNADPAIIPAAQTIKYLSYAEAKELAIGTKVLHPKCIQPIQNRAINLEIRNINTPSSPEFTTIQKDSRHPSEIIALTYKEEVAMISVISESTVEIPGVLAQIFAVMGQNEINISMISQTSSEINTMFVVDAVDAEKSRRVLLDSDFFKDWFEIQVAFVSMISIIGGGVNDPQNLAKLFDALNEKNIEILALSQASNGLNITILLKKEDLLKALQTLHSKFSLDK